MAFNYFHYTEVENPWKVIHNRVVVHHVATEDEADILISDMKASYPNDDIVKENWG